MTTDRAEILQGLTDFGVAALGIILAAVPLALWVAWSPGVYLAVLAVGGASAVLIIALVDWGRVETSDPSLARSGEPTAAVSDEFVAEIQRISPLTKTHYRGAMERLRQLLR